MPLKASVLTRSVQAPSTRAIARAVIEGDEKRYEALSKSSPIGRLGRPEEIASAVLWLCSSGASYAIGHALVVDGGLTVATGAKIE